MMDARVEVRTYGEIFPTRAEILRYAGLGRGKEADAQTQALLDKALSLSRGALCGRVCFSYLPLSRKEGGLDLGFALTDSTDLARALDGCDRILLLAATVGVELDRLILRESRKSMAMGLLLGAIGTAAVETLCDRFCQETGEALAKTGLCLSPRFSPGYGDLPLALQREIFAYLDCPRRIGLTLGESLLMTPAKSVTAIAGIRASTN